MRLAHGVFLYNEMIFNDSKIRSRIVEVDHGPWIRKNIIKLPKTFEILTKRQYFAQIWSQYFQNYRSLVVIIWCWYQIDRIVSWQNGVLANCHWNHYFACWQKDNWQKLFRSMCILQVSWQHADWPNACSVYWPKKYPTRFPKVFKQCNQCFFI